MLEQKIDNLSEALKLLANSVDTIAKRLVVDGVKVNLTTDMIPLPRAEAPTPAAQPAPQEAPASDAPRRGRTPKPKGDDAKPEPQVAQPAPTEAPPADEPETLANQSDEADDAPAVSEDDMRSACIAMKNAYDKLHPPKHGMVGEGGVYAATFLEKHTGYHKLKMAMEHTDDRKRGEVLRAFAAHTAELLGEAKEEGFE